MIEFKCQHCGKGLHLNDTYAGRDGWCRVCKRMVIVPGGDGPIQRVEDLPPEEGYERLQRLLQYAATKADKYKIHLARQAKEQEHTAQLEESLQQARVALSERDAAQERLRAECGMLAHNLRQKEARVAELDGALREHAGAANEELLAQLNAARAELGAEQEAHQQVSMALAERDRAYSALEAEMAALCTVSSDFQRLEEASAADRVNLRALEGAVATLKSQLHQAETERDRMASILEEGATDVSDSTLLLLQKDREISALNASLSELKAQREETGRSTRDQIAAMESQVLLFNEIKERMVGLQSRIRELEQERLDGSLALDGAHQSEALLQKKITAIEASLAEALSAQAERGIASDHLQRDLAVRDEQIRKLTEELQIMAAGQGDAVLELEKSARLAKSAEGRAERLMAEIQELHQAQERIAVENDGLKRGVAELEARINSLNESLDAARADAAAKASHEPAAAALQAELSTSRLALQRAEEGHAAVKASLEHSVAELQAEIMNLSQAIQREEERASAAETALTSRANAKKDAASHREALAARERALAAAEQRIAELEEQRERDEELSSLHQVDEEHLAQALGESRARIAELEGALAAAQMRREADEAEEDDDEGDVGFILLSPESGSRPVSESTVVPPDGVDEQRRHLEKKQMMDALSDFLNK
jgi:chromosome segregation ATPase